MNNFSVFIKTTDNTSNLDVDNLIINESELNLGTAEFNTAIVDDVLTVTDLESQSFTSSRANYQYAVSNSLGFFDFITTQSTSPVFRFLDKNNQLSTSILECNNIVANIINNFQTTSVGHLSGTLLSSQVNTQSSSVSEAGYSSGNYSGATLQTVMQCNTTPRGIIRTSSIAFGLDLDAQGPSKTMRLMTNSTPQITLSDTNTTLALDTYINGNLYVSEVSSTTASLTLNSPEISIDASLNVDIATPSFSVESALIEMKGATVGLATPNPIPFAPALASVTCSQGGYSSGTVNIGNVTVSCTGIASMSSSLGSVSISAFTTNALSSRGNFTIASSAGYVTNTAFLDYSFSSTTGSISSTASLNYTISAVTGNISINAEGGNTTINALNQMTLSTEEGDLQILPLGKLVIGAGLDVNITGKTFNFTSEIDTYITSEEHLNISSTLDTNITTTTGFIKIASAQSVTIDAIEDFTIAGETEGNITTVGPLNITSGDLNFKAETITYLADAFSYTAPEVNFIAATSFSVETAEFNVTGAAFSYEAGAFNVAGAAANIESAEISLDAAVAIALNSLETNILGGSLSIETAGTNILSSETTVTAALAISLEAPEVNISGGAFTIESGETNIASTNLSIEGATAEIIVPLITFTGDLNIFGAITPILDQLLSITCTGLLIGELWGPAQFQQNIGTGGYFKICNYLGTAGMEVFGYGNIWSGADTNPAYLTSERTGAALVLVGGASIGGNTFLGATLQVSGDTNLLGPTTVYGPTMTLFGGGTVTQTTDQILYSQPGTPTGQVTLDASYVTIPVTFSFPNSNGSAGQALTIPASSVGPLTWTNVVSTLSVVVPSFLNVSVATPTTTPVITITLSGVALPITSGGSGSTTATGTGTFYILKKVQTFYKHLLL